MGQKKKILNILKFSHASLALAISRVFHWIILLLLFLFFLLFVCFLLLLLLFFCFLFFVVVFFFIPSLCDVKMYI